MYIPYGPNVVIRDCMVRIVLITPLYSAGEREREREKLEPPIPLFFPLKETRCSKQGGAAAPVISSKKKLFQART
jgi:hypothetical protein